MMDAGLTIVMKFSRVLLSMLVVWNLVHLSSSLSNECASNIDPGQDKDHTPVKISCTAYPNGTLITLWTITDIDRFDTIHMGYNCTIHDEELTGNLYTWVSAHGGEKAVNVLPSDSNYSRIELTCYIDGCYVWITTGYPTWVIPTATCTFFTPSSPTYSVSKEMTTEMSSILVTQTPSTSSIIVNPTPQITSGGPNIYLLLLLFVFALIVVLFILVTFLFVWKPMKRRKREWWLYGDIKNKDMLLGNEPRIDPINCEKSDYYETITIVDPLDVQPDLALTNMISSGDSFLCGPNQGADDSDGHSFSGGSDTSENGRMPLEADGNEQVGDNSSTHTQRVENCMEAQQSDSEEEGLLTSNTGMIHKGVRYNGKMPAAVMTSRQKDTFKDLSPALSQPSKSIVTSKLKILAQVTSASSREDKTHCHSIDDRCNQRKILCESNNEISSPEYIPSSEYSASSGNGMSSVVISSDIEDGRINNNMMVTEVMMESRPVPRDLCDSGSTCTSGKSTNPSDLPNVTNQQSELNKQEAKCELSEFNVSDSQKVLIVSKVSSLSHEEKKGCAILSNHAQPHDRPQQYHDNYISSSDYTSYSSEQGTSSRTGNSIGGYLADIEDMAMDTISLQSDLKSDKETHNGLHDESHDFEEDSRSDYDHGEIVGLNIVLSNSLPCAQRHRRHSRRSHMLSDDDDFGLYCAVNAPINLPDSPSSGYIENFPSNVRNQNHEDTFDSDDGTYEDMTRPILLSDTSHSGYISVNPQDECDHQTKKYQYETTV